MWKFSLIINFDDKLAIENLNVQTLMKEENMLQLEQSAWFLVYVKQEREKNVLYWNRYILYTTRAHKMRA